MHNSQWEGTLLVSFLYKNIQTLAYVKKKLYLCSANNVQIGNDLICKQV